VRAVRQTIPITKPCYDNVDQGLLWRGADWQHIVHGCGRGHLAQRVWTGATDTSAPLVVYLFTARVDHVTITSRTRIPLLIFVAVEQGTVLLSPELALAVGACLSQIG
jgi:hypothetical protein